MEKIITKLRQLGSSKAVILNSKVLYAIDAKLGDEFYVTADMANNKIILTKKGGPKCEK